MTVKIAMYPGVAFHDVDKCDDHDNCIIAVMIGDDFKHHIDATEDVSKIDDNDYCSTCGQIGCGW